MDRRTVFVLSDGTGETAEKVVRAALLQFREARPALKMYSRLRDDEEIRDVIDRAAQVSALVVFTVVNNQQRDLIHQLALEKNVDAVDLIGALIGKLQSFLGMQPAMTPGLMHSISEEYFRRIEAIEFSVKNDDGRDPRSLPAADIVLVGVSRTSKTPLSMYLAQKGFRVANVPLVPDVPPPDASCDETVNPHGRTTPPAGSTTLPGPKGGQNEDGFYELSVVDNFDPNAQVWVGTASSPMLFGPFSTGLRLKITEAPGAAPSIKKIGSSQGAASNVIK